jgi:lysozyme
MGTSRRHVTLCLGGCATAAVLVVLLLMGFLRFNSPSLARFPVRGLDVSHHQGAIDWSAVARQHVDFAFIKATEGSDFTDPRFRDNWAESRAVGIPRGAYHYFSFCTPALEQATHFLSTVPWDEPQLPPAVDVEFYGNCARPADDVTIRAELAVFLREVERIARRTPIVYTTESSYRRIVRGRFPDHPLWRRNVFFEPTPPSCEPWTIWQYTDRGRIAGVPSLVDLDVCRSGSAPLRELPPRQE